MLHTAHVALSSVVVLAVVVVVVVVVAIKIGAVGPEVFLKNVPHIKSKKTYFRQSFLNQFKTLPVHQRAKLAKAK